MNKLVPILIMFGIVFFIGCVGDIAGNSNSSAINSSGALSVDTILQNPDSYVGKEITVSGKCSVLPHILGDPGYHCLGSGAFLVLVGSATKDEWGKTTTNLLGLKHDSRDENNIEECVFDAQVEATGILVKTDDLATPGDSCYYIDATNHPIKILSERRLP
jgi:hypothetical protein